MPSHLLIQIPNSLSQHHNHLLGFFNGMIKKLDKNSHKTTPTIRDMDKIIELLQLEVMEFEEQLAINKFDRNSLIELMDVANFAFLAYVALIIQGVKDEEGSNVTT